MNGLLTVSMIVKNEERFLAECLKSVQAIADDIVVVDTGSTDETVAIARSFGARVIAIEWPDDFSKARNVGLDAVTTPWVLVVDADEELIADDVPKLTAAITQPVADAYNLRIVSVMDRAENISESYVLRLFRAHPQVRFEGRVHEQVFNALGRERMTVQALDVRLLHKGYLKAVIDQRDKTERNLRLLEKQLAENPEDGYTLWQLAQTLFAADQATRALSTARQSLKHIAVDHPLWVLAQMTYAKILDLTGQPKRALKALRDGQLAYPGYTDFFFIEGLIRMKLKQWPAAEKAFLRCLELGEPRGFLMTETGVGGFKAYLRLAQSLNQQQRSKEALACLLVALKSNLAFRDGWNFIFDLLQGSSFDAVLDTIALAIHPASVVSTMSSWRDLNPNEARLLETALARLPINQQN